MWRSSCCSISFGYPQTYPRANRKAIAVPDGLRVYPRSRRCQECEVRRGSLEFLRLRALAHARIAPHPAVREDGTTDSPASRPLYANDYVA